MSEKISNSQILETLKLQTLSPDEMKSRNILGRLYGPIASFGESTRNDHWYNKELWMRQLNDEVFQEKVANKSLFLELGHPIDREPLDMEKICACIPEMPKVIGDDLYAYVDILDTPNGKILKILCDYGFVPGISSRGSGELIGENEVDPETFYLETWDIVPTPALKKARLNKVNEALEIPHKNRKSLTESLKTSIKKSEYKEGKLMSEALNRIGLSLEEDAKSKLAENVPSIDDIPWASDEDEIEESKILTEADKVKEKEEEIEIEPTEFEVQDIEIEEETNDDEELQDTDVEETIENSIEESEPAEEKTKEDEEKTLEITTVKDIKEILNSFDEDLPVEISKITINEVEYDTELFIDDNDKDKITIGISCVPTEEDNENTKEEKETEIEEHTEHEEEKTEEAIDDGDNVYIENLKKYANQNTALTEQLKSLKNQILVSNAKNNELEENLKKLNFAFERVSKRASVLVKESKISSNQIKALKEEAIKAKSNNTLNESLQSNVNDLSKQNKLLKENLSKITETAKQEKIIEARKLAEANKKTVKYQTQAKLILERYIQSKANLLGVSSREITSKLNENFSLDDIDNVCNSIMNTPSKLEKMPTISSGRFINKNLNEQVQKRRINADSSLMEVDKDLLTLAGLGTDDYY